MSVRPSNIGMTADQVVAAYNSVETQAEMDAAHLVCDTTKNTFSNNDRTRVIRAMIAALPRLKTWRPRMDCTECGP